MCTTKRRRLVCKMEAVSRIERIVDSVPFGIPAEYLVDGHRRHLERVVLAVLAPHRLDLLGIAMFSKRTMSMKSGVSRMVFVWWSCTSTQRNGCMDIVRLFRDAIVDTAYQGGSSCNTLGSDLRSEINEHLNFGK